eukprot:SAG22_NODE_276_length_13167_cov_8.415825_11_plen_336_part_00
MERLAAVNRHIAAAPASAQPVEEALRRVPSGDGPGAAGVPEALDASAPMSVFILMGQSSMAGRGMLPEFQELVPDIEAFHYLDDRSEPPPPSAPVLPPNLPLASAVTTLVLTPFPLVFAPSLRRLDNTCSWDVAREPLHIDPPVRDAGIKGKSSYPMGTGLGLGYSFARELLASGAVEGKIGLVPCAYGGSPLSRWERQPGRVDEWVGDAINIASNGAGPVGSQVRPPPAATVRGSLSVSAPGVGAVRPRLPPAALTAPPPRCRALAGIGRRSVRPHGAEDPSRARAAQHDLARGSVAPGPSVLQNGAPLTSPCILLSYRRNQLGACMPPPTIKA